MRELSAQVIAITGASRGIGAALAAELAARGAKLFICARSEERLGELQEEYPSIEVKAVDISDEEAVADWLALIEDRAGRLDVLVNNAGVLGPRASLDEISAQQWRQTVEVNVTGTFLVTSRAYDLLKRSEHPLVINLSSSVGRRGRGRWGAYSVSKFAVEGMAEVAADELSEAVSTGCVVTLNPGGTATDMRAEAYPAEDPDTLPTPEQVAATIRLLIEWLGPEQNGKKYNSRDLFPMIEAPPKSATLLPAAD